MVNENKVMASSYIINFYKDVDSLTNMYSTYRTYLMKATLKYANATKEQLSRGELLNETEKASMDNIMEQLRFYINNTMLKINALSKTVFKDCDDQIKEITELYHSFDSNLAFKDSDLTNFVTLINSLITNDIINTLLTNTEDFINELYSK